MKEAIKYYEGKHDFRAFVTENADKENCIRTVISATIEEDISNSQKIIFKFIGDGFLRYQVRNMVGLLFKVGQEKIEPSKVKEILDSKSRKKNGVTAPSEGLYLVNVVYSNLDDFIVN